MAKINLLDWREARRQERQKNFFATLAGAAVLGLVIVFGMNAKVNGDIEHQQARNALLKKEITAIEKQIKEIEQLEQVKRDLLARMRVIEELQRSRSQMVHFFEEIVLITPDGLYLTEIVQKGKDISVTGRAESNGRVSSYIRNIEASDWFQSARLIVIKAIEQAQRRVSEFKLQFRLTNPKSDEQENAQ